MLRTNIKILTFDDWSIVTVPIRAWVSHNTCYKDESLESVLEWSNWRDRLASRSRLLLSHHSCLDQDIPFLVIGCAMCSSGLPEDVKSAFSLITGHSPELYG